MIYFIRSHKHINRGRVDSANIISRVLDKSIFGMAIFTVCILAAISFYPSTDAGLKEVKIIDTPPNELHRVKLVSAEYSAHNERLTLVIQWHNMADHAVYVINNVSDHSSRDGEPQPLDLKIDKLELLVDLTHLDRTRELGHFEGYNMSRTVTVEAGEVTTMRVDLSFPLLLSDTTSLNGEAIVLPRNLKSVSVKLGYGAEPLVRFLSQNSHPEGDFARSIVSSWQTAIQVSGAIRWRNEQNESQ